MIWSFHSSEESSWGLM